MNNIPAIKSVMTHAPRSIDQEELLTHAQKIMSEKSIRHLPVIGNGRVVGIISDRDISLAIAAHVNMEGVTELRVEDVCTLNAYTVTPDTPLDEVVENMAERHIGSVLVVEHGSLAGIFTATDACHHLANCLRK